MTISPNANVLLTPHQRSRRRPQPLTRQARAAILYVCCIAMCVIYQALYCTSLIGVYRQGLVHTLPVDPSRPCPIIVILHVPTAVITCIISAEFLKIIAL